MLGKFNILRRDVIRKHNTGLYATRRILTIVLVLMLLAAITGFWLAPREARAAPHIADPVLAPYENVVVPFTATCGDGWYSGDFNPEWLTRVRHGGAGGWRAVVGENYINGAKLWTGGQVPWVNGTPMQLKLEYDSVSESATLTIADTLLASDPVVSDTVYGDFNALLITGKTSEEPVGLVGIDNVMIDGMPVGPCQGFTAQGSSGSHDIKHMLIENVSDDFTLTCDITMAWGSQARDELPGLQIDAGVCQSLEPDLVVSEKHEEWIVENSSYKVMATVVNSGSADVEGFQIGLYIDGALSATQEIASLVQGASMDVDFSNIYITQSADTVKVWADHILEVPETDENNNWMENIWTCECPDWDLNCDGRCDALDFSLLSGSFNKSGPPGWIRSDYNDDGRVDALDFSGIFPEHWMETW